MAIENTSAERIGQIVKSQKEFFHTGATLSYEFRREQLEKLLKVLKECRAPLCKALWVDLHKSEQEAVLTELSIVEGEIKNHLLHLKRWMRPEKHSFGGCNLGRLYGGVEAVALCAYGVKCVGADDS